MGKSFHHRISGNYAVSRTGTLAGAPVTLPTGDPPLSPLSDPFNGALKRPTQKANS